MRGACVDDREERKEKREGLGDETEQGQRGHTIQGFECQVKRRSTA